jgi:hypothetical protein
MDIETVIGRFREARLGRRRMTVGREAASGPAAMLPGGGSSRCATESQP